MTDIIDLKMHRNLLMHLFTCIDNTSLNAIDNDTTITEFCKKTLNYAQKLPENKNVAAVCVYPNHVSLAKHLLENSNVSVASVAGSFPFSQSPLVCKIQEIQYVIDYGADEVDIVLPLGLFFDKSYKEVFNELSAIREVAKNKILKVILETGELKTEHNIATAAQIAIDAGADFIKTSTGKSAVSATPEAAKIMLSVIAQHYNKTSRVVGLKVAGGISTIEDALVYAFMAERVMGREYISNQTFRIGTSRLTEKLFAFLTE